MNTAFALVGNGVVQNVISCLAGVTPADLGIAGDWHSVVEGVVGIGFAFNAETGEFTATQVTQEEPEA